MEFKTEKQEMTFRKEFRANSSAIIRIAEIINQVFDLYAQICPENETN